MLWVVRAPPSARMAPPCSMSASMTPSSTLILIGPPRSSVTRNEAAACVPGARHERAAHGEAAKAERRTLQKTPRSCGLAVSL